jgi:hypothetical protein
VSAETHVPAGPLGATRPAERPRMLRRDWLGVPATGRRFENVDEIYIFRVSNGKLVAGSGVEDNLARLRQLGIAPSGG